MVERADAEEQRRGQREDCTRDLRRRSGRKHDQRDAGNYRERECPGVQPPAQLGLHGRHGIAEWLVQRHGRSLTGAAVRVTIGELSNQGRNDID
jgi:hypothetical protein